MTELLGMMTTPIPAMTKGLAVGTTPDPTTTSATFVLMPEMTLTRTTVGGDLVVDFGMSARVTGTLVLADTIEVTIFLDGIEVPSSRRAIGYNIAVTLDVTLDLTIQTLLSTVAAGSHTVEVRWRRPGATGAARCEGTRRSLRVLELMPTT